MNYLLYIINRKDRIISGVVSIAISMEDGDDVFIHKVVYPASKVNNIAQHIPAKTVFQDKTGTYDYAYDIDITKLKQP